LSHAPFSVISPHDREHHAQGLRPVRQGGEQQVVRTSPDIKEDQRPEVDDRQAIAVNRAFGLLGHEIIHHRQEARGQEEAHRVVAIPPLHQRTLHPAEHRIAAAAQEADGNVEVVDQVQHRHGQDEGEVEPVGHIDVRFRALHQRADEDGQIGNPDHRQPQIDIPFRLGIFLALGDAQEIAGGGQHDEQLIAPEHEAGEGREGQTRAAGALHDIV
jgi:23S rRNA (cytosine1962-C5)-methyltransferase